MDNPIGTLLDESYLLSQVVDKYMIRRMISNKKFYPAYLVTAGDVWRFLFKNTMFSTQSEWMTLKQCRPEDFGGHGFSYYIDVPKGMNRLFNICEIDECGNQVILFYNNEMNVVVKPKDKNCFDKPCGCAGGLCDDINSISKTTKLLFTINNVDYYEVTWLKICPNGDIIEYREIPTKKYNNFSGDGGDYNYDYNNDYLIGNPPFSDFTIVTETFQKILCKMDLKECGCPKETEQNRETFDTHCCGFVTCCSNSKKRRCEATIGDINDNGRGHVKMSDCGTKIYYKPSRHRHNWNCGCGQCGSNKKLPTHLLVNFQTTGMNCSSSVLVPEYCLEAMFAGIFFFSIQYNGSYSATEKQMAKWNWVDNQNQIISFLNPFNLIELAQVQDQIIRF